MGQLDLLHDTVLAEDYPETAPLSAAQTKGEKSATALRSISEVAAELDIEPHVLRFWEEKFSQIQPVKLKGGRRYYRPEDIALLHRIQDLLHHQGYTIKGAQSLLRKEQKLGADIRADATPARITSTVQAAAQQISRTQVQSVLAELKQMRSILLTLVK